LPPNSSYMRRKAHNSISNIFFIIKLKITEIILTLLRELMVSNTMLLNINILYLSQQRITGIYLCIIDYEKMSNDL